MFDVAIQKIIIPKEFQDIECSVYKIERAKQYIRQNNHIDKPIAVNNNLVLLDGYSRYLAAKALGLKKVPCERHEQFIYGTFEGNPKRYIWANRNHIPIKRGDLVIVENRQDEFATVKVRKIFSSAIKEQCPPRKTILRKVTNY